MLCVLCTTNTELSKTAQSSDKDRICACTSATKVVVFGTFQSRKPVDTSTFCVSAINIDALFAQWSQKDTQRCLRRSIGSPSPKRLHKPVTPAYQSKYCTFFLFSTYVFSRFLALFGRFFTIHSLHPLGFTSTSCVRGISPRNTTVRLIFVNTQSRPALFRHFFIHFFGIAYAEATAHWRTLVVTQQ